jgi:hypothetical protein
MGKTLPTRLKPAKQHRTKVHNTFSNTVIAKRRKAFYTTGKGSVGVLIRYPRLVRYVRRIRKEQNKRYEELTGSTEKRNVLFKSFPEVLIGAVDAYANRIMEFAAAHAKARNKDENKGLKLKISDLEFAIYWIKRFSNE